MSDDTIKKFDENFFKMAEQKKEELFQELERGGGTVAEKEKEHIRRLVNEFAAPLESKAFESGKLAGLAEADENRRTRAMEEMAIERGLVVDPSIETSYLDDKASTKKRDVKKAGPMEQARLLAQEAKEFVATEEKAGRTVAMAEAIKHVYEKAGVPTR
jgi:hypothetical protein